MARHLHLDPVNGLSGDMFLGILFDLGCPPEVVSEALRHLPVASPWKLTTRRVQKHGLAACQAQVLVGGAELAAHTHDDDHGAHGHGHAHGLSHGHDHTHVHGHAHAHAHAPAPAPGHAHAHVRARDILAMIERLEGPGRVRRRARRIVTHLAEAEAKIHGTTPEEVHFHEVGAVDSIVDMLGAAVALEHLGIDTLSCGRLPLGSGFVRCQHGMMPLPAPATALLLTGIPTYGVDREGETVTPTGAALVKALCSQCGPQPEMLVEKVGVGAGEREEPEVPNIARGMLGTLVARDEAEGDDWHATLEALSPGAKQELQYMIDELTGTRQVQ